MFLKTSNNISELDQSKNSMGQHQSRRRYNRKNTLAVQYSPGLSSNEQHLFWEAFKHSTGLVPEFVPTKPGALFEIVDFGSPLSMQEKHAIEKSIAEAREIMDYGKAVHLSENDFYLQTKYIKFPMGFKGLSSALLQSESLIYALDLMSLDRDLTLKMTSNVFDHQAHVERLQESLSHLGVVPQVRHQIYPLSPNDPISLTNSHFSQQWNLELIKADDAWERLQAWVQDTANNPNPITTTYTQGMDMDITFGSQKVVIGVIDDGVISHEVSGQETGIHPGLSGTVTGGSNKAVGFLRRDSSLGLQNNNRITSGSHGTSVAGVATAKAVTQSGGANQGELFVGVAPNCRYAAVDFNTSSLLKASLWLINTDVNGLRLDEEMRIPLGNQLNLVNGVDIINLSIQTGGSGNNTPFTLPFTLFDSAAGIILNHTSSRGRKGRGTPIVIAAGNDGLTDIIANQLFASFQEPIIVGATSYELVNTGGNIVPVREVLADYSSHGERLDVVAPAGGSSKGDAKYGSETYTSTLDNTGNLDTSSIFSTSISGNISAAYQDSEFDVISNNLPPLYPGMSVGIGNSSNGTFECRTITKVSVTGTTYSVTCSPKFVLSHGSGASIELYGTSETLTASTSSSTVDIEVSSTVGFCSGATPPQKIYLGIPLSSGGIERTISSIDHVNKKITLTSTVGTAFPAGTDVIAGPVKQVPSGSFTVQSSEITIPLSSVDGLIPGQNVQAKFQNAGSSTTFTFRHSIKSVDHTNNTIDVQKFGTPKKITEVMVYGGAQYTTQFGGTSSAAPVVSGVAALVLSANPDLSYLEVKDILKKSADKLELSEPGIWKDANGNSVIETNPLTGFVAVSPTTTISIQPIIGGTEIEVASVNGFVPDQLIRINTEFFAIWKIDSTNNLIHVKNPVKYVHSNGDNVDGGRVAFKSHRYGAGRINAERAVEEAIAYESSQRDLMIRDVFPFNNVGDPIDPALIDSPDIWIRNTHPNIDTGALPTSIQSGADVHENPAYDSDRWVYVRVKNRGTKYASLEGSRIAISVTFTKANLSVYEFPFPKLWHSEEGKNGTTEIQNGEDYRTHILTFNYRSDSIYDTNLVDEPWPELLPEILPGGEHIIKVPWPKDIRSKKNAYHEHVFVKAHIVPFDGPESALGNQVHLNSNLSFKKVAFECNCAVFNDIDNTEYLSHPVSADGNLSSKDVKVQFVNSIDSSQINNLRIVVRRKLKTGSVSLTTYRYSSGWGFSATNNFITFNGAPTSSGGTGIQQFVEFDGVATLDDSVLWLRFNLKIGSTTLAVQTITTDTEYLFSPEGIDQNKVPQIHTFTDFDLLPQQSAINNFGAISDTEYRTSALFAGILGAPPLPAYAVADGEVFITETQNGLINLILKPRIQPSNRFSPVKYFVYKGLKKSSFLDGGNQPAPSGTSELLTEMHQMVTTFNTQHNGVSGFAPINLKRSDLGLPELGDPSIPSKTTVDYMYDHFTFKKVRSGLHLGDFDTNEEYGFQVLVEAPNRRHTVGDTAVVDHIVTINYSGGQPQFSMGMEEDIQTKLSREQVLGYVDPAAFYGNLFNEKVVLHQGGGSTELTGQDIYDNILPKFATSDKVYVDIRNAYNDSLNFYGNFGSGNPGNPAIVKFKDQGGTWVNKEYHDGNGWPILVLNQGEFPANNTDPKERLSLQLPEGDNTVPMVVLHAGSFYDNFENERERYLIPTLSANYTSEVKLAIPNNNTVGRVYPQIFRLSYPYRHDNNNLFPAVFPASNIIKHDLLDTLMTFDDFALDPSAGEVIWKTSNDERFIGWSSYVAQQDFMTKQGIVKDELGVILMAFRTGPTEVSGTSSTLGVHPDLNLSKGRIRQVSFYNALMDPLKLCWPHSSAIDNGSIIPCLIVDSVAHTYSDDILEQSTDDLFTVAMNQDQFQNVQDLANSNFLAGSTTYLAALNHELNDDNNGTPYYTFEIGIQGVVYDPGTFSHHIDRIGSSIVVYSLDGRNYFSEDYTSAWISANS